MANGWQNHRQLMSSAVYGKAKSGCHLGMLKVNKLRHSYLNVMKLENYGPTGGCLNDNH
jgi:hypothetical protein